MVTVVLLPPDPSRDAALKVRLPESWGRKPVGRLRAKLCERHNARCGDASRRLEVWSCRLRLGRSVLADDVACEVAFRGTREPCVALVADAFRYPALLARGGQAGYARG